MYVCHHGTEVHSAIKCMRIGRKRSCRPSLVMIYNTNYQILCSLSIFPSPVKTQTWLIPLTQDSANEWDQNLINGHCIFIIHIIILIHHLPGINYKADMESQALLSSSASVSWFPDKHIEKKRKERQKKKKDKKSISLMTAIKTHYDTMIQKYIYKIQIKCTRVII